MRGTLGLANQVKITCNLGTPTATTSKLQHRLPPTSSPAQPTNDTYERRWTGY